jgi:hypothetical protein
MLFNNFQFLYKNGIIIEIIGFLITVKSKHADKMKNKK